MVNFKAGGHQGQRARAQAAQNVESVAVSKNEKRALLRRPWSSTDPLCREVVNDGGIALQVVAREKVIAECEAFLKAALVSPETLGHFQQRAPAGTDGGSRPLLSRPGGDFVLAAMSDEAAAPGELLLGEAQRLSLHVCEGEVYEWVPWSPPAEDDLAELALEVALLEPLPAGDPPLRVGARGLEGAAAKWLFGMPVTINELFIAALPPKAFDDADARGVGTRFVLRVTGLVSAEADADDDRVEASVEPHCFRGAVGPATEVHVSPSTNFKGSDSQRAVAAGLALQGCRPRRAVRSRPTLELTTSDGETFPVNPRLLRPCIALTKAVRSLADVSVDVDCATLDRVLLYLEAHARGAEFAADISALDDLKVCSFDCRCESSFEGSSQ